jgi:shikimate kinase/3-dehydroquinate synthase
MTVSTDKKRIFLIGFSGTGKSSAGRVIANILGWEFKDVDELISLRLGKSIEKIFSEDGESVFRDQEVLVINELSNETNSIVVSTGAGAVTSESTLELLKSTGFVINLEASPELIYQRLSNIHEVNGAEAMVRPLLSSSDPINRIRGLKSERQFLYMSAHWTIHTDQMSTGQVANEAVRAWRKNGNYFNLTGSPNVVSVVNAESGSYPVVVGWNILEEQLGSHIHGLGIKGRAHIICDSNVVHPYGRSAQRSLHNAGIEMTLFTFPAGEASKNLKTVETIYEWLASKRVERGDVVIAVGGGVVGDVAGYVASTILRGIKLIQVPTSLTAMVDSSIGGKTGVDLPVGKNLIGAFHQPIMVLADVAALKTLPQRVLKEGWAEAIKHGFAFDETLVEIYENELEMLLGLDPEVTTSVISKNIKIKSDVVTNDEREVYGLRQLLNYGHTIGHGVEAAAGYDRYLHGEAVSIGMIGAAKLGEILSVTPIEVVNRLIELITRFDLPVNYTDVSIDDIQAAMSRDKKMLSGEISWVLLDAVGHAMTYKGVDQAIVWQVLKELSKT